MTDRDQAKMGLTWASPLQQAKNAASEKPKREWHGLTEDELRDLYVNTDTDSRWWFARAIEAKLKEKNGFR